MAGSCDDARSGKLTAWAYASMVHGDLSNVLDDEGRPLAERRAESAGKQGVPILLKPCPYGDERLGTAMNVSALAQISRHFEAALADLAGFRAADETREPTWEHVLTAVVDQLGAPALVLLRTPGLTTVPVAKAVAHKLAAGYFGVVRGLVADAAAGEARPVTVDGLLSHVHATRALLGASEACAGPPPMLRRATQVLLHGAEGATPVADRSRVEVARRFRQQVQVGMAWELFDAAFEPAVLKAVRAAEARTAFYARKLEERSHELAAPRSVTPCAALPSDLDLTLAGPLRRALAGERTRGAGEIEGVAALDTATGAVIFGSAERRAELRASLERYLETYVAVVGTLVALETRLRAAIGVPDVAPVRMHETILPRSRALHWMETALGCRLSCEPAAPPVVRLTCLAKPSITMGSASGDVPRQTVSSRPTP